LAAAAYLSINEFRSCLQILVRGNELYLAFIIAKHFCKEALPEIALLLAERAEKYFCADLALQLITKYANDSKTASLLKRRLLNSGLLKDATRDTAVLSLPNLSTTDVVSRVYSLIVENQLNEACTLAAASMKKAYDGQDSPETLFYLNDLIQ